jgi:hypothetical protein
MSLFHRNKPTLIACPQCSQLLEVDTLECDMCGYDLREAQPVGVGGGGEQPLGEDADVT